MRPGRRRWSIRTSSSDFLELLRPATILGKIPGLRNVPFNTKVPSQTAGGTYGWVGEAKPKPVTKLAFSSTSLGITKVAGIIVLTEGAGAALESVAPKRWSAPT